VRDKFAQPGKTTDEIATELTDAEIAAEVRLVIPLAQHAGWSIAVAALDCAAQRLEARAEPIHSQRHQAAWKQCAVIKYHIQRSTPDRLRLWLPALDRQHPMGAADAAGVLTG
jgi:hypothetical protein